MSKEELLAAGQKAMGEIRQFGYMPISCNRMENAGIAFSLIMQEDPKLGRENLIRLAQTSLDHIQTYGQSNVRCEGFASLYKVAIALNDDELTGIMGMMIADQASGYSYVPAAQAIYAHALRFAKHFPEAGRYVKERIALRLLSTPACSQEGLVDLLEL